MKCRYCDKELYNDTEKPQSLGYCRWDCYYGYRQLSMLKKEGIKIDKYIEPRHLPLFDAQELFCEKYVELHSEAKAYMVAFPDKSEELNNDYQKIRSKARFLLRYPFIRRRVNELLEEQLAVISKNRVLVIEGFLNIATANIADFLEKGGSVKDPTTWTDQMGKACKKYVRKYDKDGVLKEESIELYDKLNALSALAKIEKMYKDTLDVNVNHTIASTVKTYGDDDVVAKLLESELEEARSIAFDKKQKQEVIEAEVEEAK